MALRVSEDAEVRGMDEDQFFDEEVGDWSLFEHAAIPHQGTAKLVSTPPSPPNGVEKTVQE
jgi:Amt family ammonium transporter